MASQIMKMTIQYNTVVDTLAVHLLATDCIVTTNCITLPYKIVYLDSKIVTATMHNMHEICG